MLTIMQRQRYLKKLHLYSGVINGIENAATKKAYRLLQEKYFTRKSDIDGIYGPDTDKLLCNVYNVAVCTKNFKPHEFKCECGGKYCTGYPDYLSKNLLRNIQKLRTKYGKPMIITSGLRCRGYNNSLTGSITTSKHLEGKAVDLYIQGKSDTVAGRKDIIRAWMTYPKASYAYQGTANMGNATHVDVSK